jgi:hypothetical protein
MNIADERTRPFEPDSWIPPSRMEADHVPRTGRRFDWGVAGGIALTLAPVVVLVAAWVLA